MEGFCRRKAPRGWQGLSKGNRIRVDNKLNWGSRQSPASLFRARITDVRAKCVNRSLKYPQQRFHWSPRKNYDDTNRKFIHFSFAYPIFLFLLSNFQTRWWKHNNLYTKPASYTFSDRKQILYILLKRIFCWSFSPPNGVFLFIFVRFYLGLWKSTNVLSSKPDAGEENDEFVYLQRIINCD